MLIDSHVHLDMREFRHDLDEVLDRAAAAGISEMLQICYDSGSIASTLDLVGRYEAVFGTAGIHPHEAKHWDSALEQAVRKALQNEKILAVGEIGLDFYRDLSPRHMQKDVFRRQISLALEVGKPIVVHSREAFGEVVSILQEEGAREVGGIFHAFPEGPSEAAEVLSLGFLVGIGGPITYKKSRIAETAIRLPSYGFVLETDCPYLPPEPFRGKRNEPAYVTLVRDKLAQLRGVDTEDIERAASLNYRRLLHRDPLPAPSIAYALKGNLYVNVTSECTNDCVYCMRFDAQPVLYGYNLRLASDPSVRQMVESAKELARKQSPREIVFCGLGEPTCRLPELLEAARSLRALGYPLRLDTNGHGNLIAGSDIVPQLETVFDSISVGLGAHDSETYARLCRSRFEDRAFEGVLGFIRSAASSKMRCVVTVLDHPSMNVEAARSLIASIPGAAFRVRRYQTGS